jgi:hypothetical protein
MKYLGWGETEEKYVTELKSIIMTSDLLQMNLIYLHRGMLPLFIFNIGGAGSTSPLLL